MPQDIVFSPENAFVLTLAIVCLFLLAWLLVKIEV